MTLVCFCRFNTSHVTLYHFSLEHLFIVWTRFNTSHVTLYRCYIHRRYEERILFQYISCYSLSKTEKHQVNIPMDVSIHLMLLFIWMHLMPISREICFNTSHVTLYRAALEGTKIGMEFQYISCYSLSLVL